jgi:hypothetical protein
MTTTQDRGRWYLSFDCATKSFAFALLHVRGVDAGVLERARAATTGGQVAAVVAALDADTRQCFALAAGGAVDLAPGRKDADIPTVERVRLVRAYLRGAVAAALAAAAPAGCPSADSADLNVAVEYQMGANTRARTVATVLLTEFAEANVFMVGPAHKNKVRFASRPDLHHALFIEKYASLYTANKKHTRALYFDHIAPLFGHDTRAVPRKYQTDFADCVIQVLGFLQFGDPERAAEYF